MKVSQLINYLENFDGDLEVRLAMQPNWPFEYTIGTVVSKSEIESRDDDGEGEFDPDEIGPDGKMKPFKDVVYLTEGRQLGYLSKEYFKDY